ncbi:DUF1343 domain-containing protein [soil metagenome]
METGLDRIVRDDALRTRLLTGRLGLVAHPASIDRSLRHAKAALMEKGARFAIVFGPEHGYGGEAQDMIGVGDARDRDGTKVRSLYGEDESALVPNDDDLRAIDTLVVDLQDVGSRYYTFVWTAVLALRAASRLGVRVLVLDRPNPISGLRASLEGRTLLPPFRSFVVLEPIAIRHALTLGEIVGWRAAKEKLSGLTIVSTDAPRDLLARDWDRSFALPSPNMPTFETTLVYPGGCLLEGTNLSDGRGTTRPFEITGAPFVDGDALAADLAATNLPGFVARPITFRPTFHKHSGQNCGGVQIHVTDPSAFRPVATYVALIAAAHHRAPDAFRFRTERYEFIDHIPAFDLLTGDAEARTRILAGDAPTEVAQLVSGLRPGDAELWDEAIELSMPARA